MNLNLMEDPAKKFPPPARLLQWVAAGLALLLLYLIRFRLGAALAPFLYALLLAYLLSPLVKRLERWGLRRTPAIAIVYLALIVSLVLMGLYGIPTVVSQINGLVRQMPAMFVKVQDWLYDLGDEYELLNLPPAFLDALEASLARLEGSVTKFLNFIGQFTVSLFGSVVHVILVPILAFYMLKDNDTIRSGLLLLAPQRQRHLLVTLAERVSDRLGAWVRGQVSISLITGSLIFLGLKLVGMEYALALGLLVAVFNIIPYFGPIIAAVPAVLLGLIRSPLLGFKVLLVQVVVQHFESTFLVPHVLGKELGLHPLLIIFALLLGAQFAGVLGMVLAAPVAAIIYDLVGLWIKGREESIG